MAFILSDRVVEPSIDLMFFGKDFRIAQRHISINTHTLTRPVSITSSCQIILAVFICCK